MKRSILQAAAVGAVLLGFSMTASADFSGSYAPAHWTLANDVDDDGSVDVTGAPGSIMLIGSDNSVLDDSVFPPVCTFGACAPSTVRYTITAPAAGMVSFSWAYATLDEAPEFDTAGYVLNGVDYQLSDDIGDADQADVTSFAVAQGDQFGFFVHTVDNAFGAATLTISGFSAPVPEPASAAMLALGLLGLAGAAGARRRSQR